MSALLTKINLLGKHILVSNTLNKTIAVGQLKLYEQSRYAGHAKWQNIKGTKQANDLNKCRTISRYCQQVRRAVISGGRQSDPKLNGRLATLLNEASKLNIPKATLERAIARGMNVKIMQTNIEIQGPGGCSIVVRCETDNISNLRREVKKALKKFDATLLPNNSILNMFKSQGFIRTSTKTLDNRDIDADFAEEAAIFANVLEVSYECNDEVTDEELSKAWVFSADIETMNQSKGELEKQGLKVLSSDVELVPYRAVDFGSCNYEKLEPIISCLREMEQVLDVYHNVAIPNIESLENASNA